MGSRSWWKFWDTSKFLLAAFLILWWRNTKFSQKIFPHNWWSRMLSEAMTFFTAWWQVTEAGNTLSCYKAQNGITGHNPRKRIQKECPHCMRLASSLLGCWRIHICWVLSTRGNHQFGSLLLPPQRFAMHCMKNVHVRKKSSFQMTAFSPTSLTCACREFRRTARNFFYIHLTFCT